MNLFDWLNQVTYTKKPWSEFDDADKKSFSSYMINRFLSMDSNLTELINDMQRITPLLSDREVYKIYSNILPKKKSYHRYVKSKKNVKYEDWLVELIDQHYQVGKSQAVEYLDLFYMTSDGKQSLKKVVEQYGIEPKLIKKLKLEE